jgi:hypothetical protein
MPVLRIEEKMSGKEKKGCFVSYHYQGNIKHVLSVRCLDCDESAHYVGHDEQWHGESDIFHYKCPRCHEEYAVEQVWVDTSA